MCMFVDVLCSFIYETEHHNGIAELLEILGRYNIFPTSVLHHSALVFSVI